MSLTARGSGPMEEVDKQVDGAVEKDAPVIHYSRELWLCGTDRTLSATMKVRVSPKRSDNEG